MKPHLVRSSRRDFIKSTLVLGAAGLPGSARGATAPTANPLARLGLGWTDKLRWDFVVDITTVAGGGES